MKTAFYTIEKRDLCLRFAQALQKMTCVRGMVNIQPVNLVCLDLSYSRRDLQPGSLGTTEKVVRKPGSGPPPRSAKSKPHCDRISR